MIYIIEAKNSTDIYKIVQNVEDKIDFNNQILSNKWLYKKKKYLSYFIKNILILMLKV